MRYLSVCSGIEAATVAWKPLGWECAGVAEVESFPKAVLEHHYPDTPNYGDITKFHEWPELSIDLLVGGTPCQSFSVAGLRKGMADPRGNLALTFLGIADRYRPTWILWENVPGVLSSNNGWDFGAFLGGLGKLGYGFAYRVLDAQYFGLAQRRKRVFVVGHIGGFWQRAAAVLFEPESLRGDPAPSREKREGTTHSLAPCLGASGRGFERTGDTRGQDAVIPTTFQNTGQGYWNESETGQTLRGSKGAGAYESNIVAHALKGEGFDASEDGTGRATPSVPDVAWALQERDSKGSDSSTKEGHLIPVGFSSKDHGGDAEMNLSPTLRAGGHNHSHANAGVPPAVAFQQNQLGEVRAGEVAGTLNQNTNASGRNTPMAMTQAAVRRLTPLECERLQGFPDDYTNIKKNCPDGPRYKALGNSMAVPVMRWLGERIQLVNNLAKISDAAKSGNPDE